jgi:hypothetical protein
MKKVYKHDYSGSCAPEKDTISAWNTTFSVGIFQWLPKSSGKGLKKSAVKFRIKGDSSDTEKVYKKAKEICRIMNGGFVPGTKSMTV